MFGVFGGNAKEIGRKENAKKSLRLTDADIPGDFTVLCIVHILCTTLYCTSVNPWGHTLLCIVHILCTALYSTSVHTRGHYCTVHRT